MIEIGVIDDDQMLLQGMAAWIGSTGDIRLTVTAASVEEYLGTAHIPKIVILASPLGASTRTSGAMLAGISSRRATSTKISGSSGRAGWKKAKQRRSDSIRRRKSSQSRISWTASCSMMRSSR